MNTKLYEKDEKGIFRLLVEVPEEQIKKAKMKKDPVFVLAKSIEDDKDTVLFVHGNKKGKKVYRAKKKDISFDLRKDGNFGDFLSEEVKQKLKG